MKKARFLAPTLALVLSLTGTANAAKFSNQFTEFEVPPQWQCNLEGSEWICQSTVEAKKRDAIIVLAAKLKGDQDSLDQYLAFLKNAKSFTSIAGKPVKSEVKYAKFTTINGQNWIDALHIDSEIPGYYTRYLATIQKDIGVLITYSIDKNKYQEYLNDFDTLVRTLKVFRKTGGINAGTPGGSLFDKAAVPGAVTNDSVFAPSVGDEAPKQAKKNETLPLPLILGVGGALALILWLRKRNQG